MDLAPQLVLGTVQLGLPYGARATEGLMTEKDAFAVLDAAWEFGIRAFDVAEAYGASCERLAAWLDARRRGAAACVVTKVRIDDLTRFSSRLNAAVSPFTGVGGLALLTHGAAGHDVWALMRDAAAKTGASLGQSVYGPAEVRAATETPGVVLVQAPGSLFDRRALDARGDRSVSLDLRSVYLQGVLLAPAAAAERRAPGAGVLAAAVQAAADEIGQPTAALLLAAMLRQLRAGDRLVLGFDGPSQIGELALACGFPSGAVEAFREAVARRVVVSPDDPVLDPRTWPSAT
jgi:aryl-alcohol dehydrogenase-like predicted oxidoreductase